MISWECNILSKKSHLCFIMSEQPIEHLVRCFCTMQLWIVTRIVWDNHSSLVLMNLHPYGQLPGIFVSFKFNESMWALLYRERIIAFAYPYPFVHCKNLNPNRVKMCIVKEMKSRIGPKPWVYENLYRVTQVFLMRELPYRKSGVGLLEIARVACPTRMGEPS